MEFLAKTITHGPVTGTAGYAALLKAGYDIFMAFHAGTPIEPVDYNLIFAGMIGIFSRDVLGKQS